MKFNLEKNKLSFDVEIDEIEDYNPTFKKCSMRVFAFGKNRNMSNITKESFINEAKNTLFYIPIVSMFNPSEVDKYGNSGDLEDHNVKLKKNSDGVPILQYDTYPVGTIPADCNISYEEVDEGDGNIATYVKLDKVLLWKRYEAVQKVEEWFSQGVNPKISMEIYVNDGYFDEETESYKINSWHFEAVCILGSYVEPAFPEAELIEFNSVDFNKLYMEMLTEIKNMKEVVTQQDNKIESLMNFKGGNNVGIFKLSNEQLVEELMNVLEKEDAEETDYGFSISRYFYLDFKDDVVFAFDRKDDFKIFGFKFKENGDAIEIDFESKKRYKIEFVEFEGEKDDKDNEEKYDFNRIFNTMMEFSIKSTQKQFEEEDNSSDDEDVNEDVEENEQDNDNGGENEDINEEQDTNDDFQSLKNENENLKNRLKSLKQYKEQKEKEEREQKEQEIYAKFTDTLSEDEINQIKEKSKDMSLEQIENSLYAVLGQKAVAQFSNKSKSKNNDVVTVPVQTRTEEDNKSPYGDLFDKYAK